MLAVSGLGAAIVSDWFVEALQPTMATLGMSEAFAGLVIVAIAGNAVENVVGVQMAIRNKADLAISLILNSSLQVAIALTPALVLISFFFAGPHLTLVLPALFIASVALAAILTQAIVSMASRTGWKGWRSWACMLSSRRASGGGRPSRLEFSGVLILIVSDPESSAGGDSRPAGSYAPFPPSLVWLVGGLLGALGVGGYLFWILRAGLLKDGNWIGVDFHVYYQVARVLSRGEDIYAAGISPPYVYRPCSPPSSCP